MGRCGSRCRDHTGSLAARGRDANVAAGETVNARPPRGARGSVVDGVRLALLVPVRDARAVPVQRQVRRRLGVAQRARPEDADALAAGVAHARIADAPAPRGAQAPAEALRRAVVVGIEDRGVAVGVRRGSPSASSRSCSSASTLAVMRRMSTSIAGSCGAAQEHAAVMAHLGDRRLERVGGVVDAVGAVGKARAFGVEVGERGHHRRRAGAAERALPSAPA